MIVLTPHSQGIILQVRTQPGARKNAVTGEHAGALKVAVSAPPERGKANAAVAALLAEVPECKSSQIEILSGESSREMKFLLIGISSEHLALRLEILLAKLSSEL